MSQLTVQQLKPRLADGCFFSVVFRKRTTGELRRMVARTGVKKHLHGGKLNYNPDEIGLLVVYDVQKKAYRTISVDDIKELNFHGESHFFP